jgi:hypothetical protein
LGPSPAFAGGGVHLASPVADPLIGFDGRASGNTRRAMVQIVDAAGRWRWERMLLLVAVMLGVVAMHALAAGDCAECGPGPGMPPVGAAAAGMGGEMDVAGPHAVPVDHGRPGPMPEPMSHDVLHLCLAVLAAAIVLGLTAVAYATRSRRGAGPDRRASNEIGTVWPRPPPRRTAVRLAQLCVLRN